MEQIQDDFQTASLAEPTRALLQFARRLTLAPWKMRRQDVEELRQHGLNDEAIHDAVQIAAYFNYINRVCDALGVELEDFMPPKPPEWDRDPP